MTVPKSNPNKFLPHLVSLSLLVLIFVLPVVTLADNPYVPLVTCGNAPVAGTGSAGPTGVCTFNDLIDTINRIINWIISIATVIFAVSFIYGGFLYMTAGDKPANKGKATNILWSTLKGFVIILVAWVIVYTILNTLVVGGSSNSMFNFIGKM